MKMFFLYLMALVYVLAGFNHFRSPETYLAIMPPYIPAHELMVQLSGVAESLLGILLLWPKTRRLAAWGLIALLIAVFPANYYMYQARDTAFAQFPAWVLLVRLFLQPMLMFWAYLYTAPTKSPPKSH